MEDDTTNLLPSTIRNHAYRESIYLLSSSPRHVPLPQREKSYCKKEKKERKKKRKKREKQIPIDQPLSAFPSTTRSIQDVIVVKINGDAANILGELEVSRAHQPHGGAYRRVR